MNIEPEFQDEIPEQHKHILDMRINAFETGEAQTIDWEEAKKRLLSGKKLPDIQD